MTTLQTGLPGIGTQQAQIDMLGEFSGKDGKKQKLIDLDKYKSNQEAKKEAERLKALGQGGLI